MKYPPQTACASIGSTVQGVLCRLPVLGVVVAETAGVEAADVLAGKLRLNPPPVLDAGVAPANEKPPEEAGVEACVAAAGVAPKIPPDNYRKRLTLLKGKTETKPRT